MMLKNKVINSDSRSILFIVTAAYSLFVSWGYFSYLEPVWGYFRIKAAEQSLNNWLLCIFFCILPVFFIPVKIFRPSIFIVWILYYLTYIPMLVGVCFDASIPNENRLIISLSYFLGFSLLSFFYKFKLYKSSPSKLPSKYFWIIFYFVLLFMLGFVIVLFRNNLTFANLFYSNEVYDIRFEGHEIEKKSPIAGYFVMWLSNALLPFLLSVGLIKKNKVKIIISISGLILLYMTMANKQFILSILYLFIIYKLFNSKYPKKIFLFTISITVLTSTLLLLFKYIESDGLKEIIFLLSGIVLLRTIYTSTFMSIYYNSFFDNHPHTNFSHISGVNKLIDYPYKNSLGIEVGSYFTEFTNYNANANFFITDGLSSIGLIGVILMGFIASFVFFIFDSFAARNNIILGILLLSSTSVALMNVSLFTTLISGGFLFFVYLMNNNNILKE